MNDISHKDVWSFNHAGLPCEINLHSVGQMVNDGNGIWCYYVLVPEAKCSPGVFEQLWLPDRRVKFTPASPERITYDYEHLLADCQWHGGITYYEKHGHSEGHRCVQIGCDFAHLWDCERGGRFELSEIEFECRRSAELVAAELIRLHDASIVATPTTEGSAP